MKELQILEDIRPDLDFYRAMLSCYALERGYATLYCLSVCLSVRP